MKLLITSCCKSLTLSCVERDGLRANIMLRSRASLSRVRWPSFRKIWCPIVSVPEAHNTLKWFALWWINQASSNLVLLYKLSSHPCNQPLSRHQECILTFFVVVPFLHYWWERFIKDGTLCLTQHVMIISWAVIASRWIRQGCRTWRLQLRSQVPQTRRKGSISSHKGLHVTQRHQ